MVRCSNIPICLNCLSKLKQNLDNDSHHKFFIINSLFAATTEVFYYNQCEIKSREERGGTQNYWYRISAS